MPKTHAEHSARAAYDPLSLDESRVSQFIQDYGRFVLYGVIGLIIGLFALYYYQSGKTIEAQADYIRADVEMKRFQNNPTFDLNDADSPYNKLVTIMKRHPELHAKYDGLIAQSLLLKNEPALAEKYLDSSLKRTSLDKLPLYGDFSKVTLLIANKQFEEALKQSQALKEKMLSEKDNAVSYSDTLFALNLLRISLLQPYAGNPQTELQALEEFKQYANLNGGQIAPSDTYVTLLKQLQDGTINLLNYIEERQKGLK